MQARLAKTIILVAKLRSIPFMPLGAPGRLLMISVMCRVRAVPSRIPN